MSFLTAIPVIGGLIDSIGNAIDRNITTDEERLKLKAEITALYIPVIIATIEAQKSANEMQVKIAKIEGNSPHFLVWARRPIISFLATFNVFVSAMMYNMGQPYMDVQSALIFAGVVNGIDMTSRGVEKVMKNFKSKELI